MNSEIFMYFYFLVILSTCIFGSNFMLENQYQRRCGSGIRSSLVYSLIGSSAGLLVLLIVNGFKIEFTVATLCVALLVTVNGLVYTFCSLRAMGLINLSLYSVFAMLGGMVLPSIVGMVFYSEAFTLAKGVCFAFIIAALALTVRKGESKKGTIYYIGVFVLNGMSGVFSKFFQEMPFEKTSAAGYSILAAICSVVISATLFLIIGRKYKNTLTLPAASFSVASGSLNKIANFILVFALALPGAEASVQYPIVTGGVMIISTLLCYFTPKKPSKKDLLSVALSFVGLVALVAIPI